MAIDESQIRALPKVELHVHLEGTFTLDQLRRLSRKYAATPPMSLDGPPKFAGLGPFLEFLDWCCSLMRTPDDVEQAAYDCAARASGDGTVYAEVIVNPTHWKRLEPPALLEAIAAGFERAAGDGLTDCRISVSLLRDQDADEAERFVRWMIDSRPHRVLALSVDGNETAVSRTGPKFAPLFRLAGEAGLGLTAHAGESSGPDGVRDALDLLGVSRIDHGVRAAEAADLVRRLADERVPLNVCPTSNRLLLYGSFDTHPLPRLVGAGVPVTINTDDPALLGTTLVDEIAIAAALCDWDLPDLVQMTRTAIAAAFCDEATKRKLRGLLDDASPV